MATDAHARSLGFDTPASTDLIRHGDNAISKNARATVDLFRTSTQLAIAAGRNAAITEVLASQTIIQDDESGRLYYARATPPIMADNFDRPNESPVSPTPIGAKALLPGTGTTGTTLAVDNGELAFTNTVSTATGPAYWNAGRADGTFRVTVANQGTESGIAGSGVLLRSSGPNWMDALIFDAQDAGLSVTEYRLRERLAGAYGSLILTSVPAVDGDVIEATMTGPRVVIKVNGETLIDQDFPSHTSGTHVGVMCNQRRYGVRYDDVSFTQIGA